MKLLKNEWNAGNIEASVKFFGESVIELTNQYSAPSYRHRALSTVSKAAELRAAVHEVTARIVKKPYLGPMVLEYDQALESDPIVEAILRGQGIPVDVLKLKLEDSLEKMTATLEIFFDLVAGRYEQAGISLITETCLSGGREKDLLRRCADHIVSYLVGREYSRRHIHLTAKREFSVVDVRGDEVGALKRFFSSCRPVSTRYDILINTSQLTAQHLSSALGVEIFKSKDDLPAYFRITAFSRMGLDAKGPFAVLRGFPGRDPFNAVRGAKYILEMFHAFHFVFPNGQSWEMPESACVYDPSTGAVYSSGIGEYVNEGRRIGNQSAHRELIAKMTKFTFDKLRGQQESGFKISSALQSASAASRIREGDARLISIWSAFEALLPHPSKDGENTVRINHFESYVTPLVTAGYVSDMYRHFYNDIARNYRGEFYSFLAKHGKGDDRFDQFISIFYADEAVKASFTEFLAKSELLLFRAHQLHDLANNPTALKGKMEAHEERVSWQLHRIYRARNSIVHSGTSPLHVPQLTENAFSYFKSLMELIVLAGDKFGISNSDAIFDLCASLCRKRREKIALMKKDDPEKFLLAAISKPIS